eukprot:7115304-Pyramimonas_sp.AAC.1
MPYAPMYTHPKVIECLLALCTSPLYVGLQNFNLRTGDFVLLVGGEGAGCPERSVHITAVSYKSLNLGHKLLCVTCRERYENPTNTPRQLLRNYKA